MNIRVYTILILNSEIIYTHNQSYGVLPELGIIYPTYIHPTRLSFISEV